MARARDLIPGNCYFQCHYYDRGLVFPSIQTLRFVRSALDESGEVHWLFEEPIEIREEDSDEKTVYFSFSDDQLDGILELRDLQRTLVELAHFHPLTSSHKDDSLYPGPDAFVSQYDLVGRVREVLGSQADVTLHLGMRYTDTGCFIEKSSGTLRLQFFLHPLRGPEVDAAVLELFAARGIDPSTNYFADDGRTRVLSYPLMNDADAVSAIVGEVFVSAFGIVPDDELVLGPLRLEPMP